MRLPTALQVLQVPGHGSMQARGRERHAVGRVVCDHVFFVHLSPVHARARRADRVAR